MALKRRGHLHGALRHRAKPNAVTPSSYAAVFTFVPFSPILTPLPHNAANANGAHAASYEDHHGSLLKKREIA